METLQALVDHLASPPWLFTLALVLFLACRGSRFPWTLAGGAAFLAAMLALVGLGLTDESFRRLVLHPERLPVAVFCVASLALLWFEMRRDHRRQGSPASRPLAAAASRPFATVDAVAATAIGLCLVACTLIYPARLGAVADPATRPDFVKVPWFLTGLQELSHYFHPWVPYAAVPVLLLIGLLGLPWLANDPGAGRGDRALFLFGWLFLWLWPMVVGALLRGPGWQAFGPFEPWETRLAAPAPRALSEIFWGQWLHTLEPASWWFRELPGILLLGAYFVLLPLGLLRWKATRGIFAAPLESLGPWRFYAAAAWILTLLLLPLKMCSRWLLDVGSWIHLPELSFYL